MGFPWQEAGVSASKGCGSAMRTAPVGLLYWDDEERLIDVARASSLLTHRHPTALAAAVATALLVSWAVKHEDPGAYPDRLALVARELDGGDEVAALAERITGVLDEPPERVLCEDVLGLSWVGDEAVASALYCFCRSPDDFRQAVLTAANTIGDSDSIACIAGAISGAYNGVSAIPSIWRRQVENADHLVEVADCLLARSV
jgi:ADP-ribosylglycohydrolase